MRLCLQKFSRLAAGLLILVAILAPTQASMEFVQPTDPESGISIRISTAFDSPPNYGYLPLRVTIRNGTNRDLEWWIKTNSESNQFTQASLELISTTSLPVGSGQERIFEILAPVADDQARSHSYSNVNFSMSGPGLEFAHSNSVSSDYGSNDKTPFTLISEDMASMTLSTIKTQLENQHSLDFNGSTFDPEDLPTQWRAYLGVSHLFISVPMWESLEPQQVSAIDEWIAFGGEAFLCTLDGSLVEPRDVGLPAVTVPEEEPSMYDIRSGVGRYIILPYGAEPDAVDTLISYLVASGTWDPQDVETDFTYFWGLGQKVPGLESYSIRILLFLVSFALIVGPLNLFVFARGRNRHRLFWTTPAISLGASLLLWLSISIGEGFGGNGWRMAVAVQRPQHPEVMFFQEQISRTASLWTPQFSAPVPYALTPISFSPRGGMPANDTLRSGSTIKPKKIALGRPQSFFQSKPAEVRNGRLYTGSWFSSRNIQAQWLQSLEPTRAGLKLLPDSIDGAPQIVSEYARTLDGLFFRDRDGQYWTATSLAPGVPVTMQATDQDAFDTFYDTLETNAGGRTKPVLNRMANELGYYYAVVKDAEELFLSTNEEIRWEPGVVVFIGPVLTSPEVTP